MLWFQMLCQNHFAEPNRHVLAVRKPLNVKAGDRLAVGPVTVYPETGCRSGSWQQQVKFVTGWLQVW
jgi:hypothetical protein